MNLARLVEKSQWSSGGNNLHANNVLVSSVGKGHLSDIFVYGGLLHHMEILHLVQSIDVVK